MEVAMRRALLISACLLALGCVKMRVHQWDEIVRPAQPLESVAVLLDEPDRPYTVIAVLESSVDGALQGFDDLRRKMVAEAAQLGGEALILGPESKKTRVIFVPTPIFYDEMRLTGEVIAFN
jgi:hypothetical protein